MVKSRVVSVDHSEVGSGKVKEGKPGRTAMSSALGRVVGAARIAIARLTAPNTGDNLHENLTAQVQRLLLPRGLSHQARVQLLQTTRTIRDQPDFRPAYLKGTLGAWVLLQVAVILAMAVPVAIADAIDRDGLRAIASVAAGLETFCITGALAACWWYYAALLASRAARRDGTMSAQYRRAAARATSTGRTVPYQILLGVCVTVLVIGS
jgi:hypothetical protein